MKINIVNYEAGYGIKDGILTKYAEKMAEGLKVLGHEVTVTPTPKGDNDITHHIDSKPYQQAKGINTLMVTHFTEGETDKLDLLKKAMETADLGISFSPKIKEWLTEKGIPKQEYVLPAHDSRERRPIVIAITTKAYPDGRKREYMLGELCQNIDQKKFVFRIMGHGWRWIVEPLIAKGWIIEYFEDFDERIYKAILDSSDYLLYTGGEDEGAISVLDATQAGLKTIASEAGFHKDIGIDFPFNTQEELNAIFKKLEENRVEDWTWENYCKKHIELWQNLLK